MRIRTRARDASVAELRLLDDELDARESLNRLIQELSSALADHHRRHRPEPEGVERIWACLDAAVDVLLLVAMQASVESEEAQPFLETRDSVAIHLRAAADIEVADTLPEVRMGLVVSAAEILLAADLVPTLDRPTS